MINVKAFSSFTSISQISEVLFSGEALGAIPFCKAC